MRRSRTDPKDGVLYLTEDDFGFPSGFYKYVPPAHPGRAGRIQDGGQLFMLAVEGRPNIDLSATQDPRAQFKVLWIPINNPNPTLPDHDDPVGCDPDSHQRPGATTPSPNRDGPTSGAVQPAGGRGVRRQRRVLLLYPGCGRTRDPDISTARPTGYGKGVGQIWAYHTRSRKLSVVFQSPGRNVLDFPDNATTTRKGTIILCDDNSDFNFLRGLTPKGERSTWPSTRS